MSRLVLMVSWCITACTSSSSSSGISAAELTCPPDSTLTYANFGEVFFSDHCMSCHASRNSPKLSTVEAIRANRQPIISAAVTSTGMPRGSSMSIDERGLLGEWLTCGAP